MKKANSQLKEKEMNIGFQAIEMEKDIETLCDWHQDHAAINFPDSMYKRDLFKAKVLEEEKIPKTTMMFVMVNGQIAGWIWTVVKWDVFKEIDYAELRYIHLLPEFRGKGVGGQILAVIDDFVQQDGAKEIRLGTDFQNKQSIRAYIKAGYKIKRVLMEKKYND